MVEVLEVIEGMAEMTALVAGDEFMYGGEWLEVAVVKPQRNMHRFVVAGEPGESDRVFLFTDEARRKARKQ